MLNFFDAQLYHLSPSLHLNICDSHSLISHCWWKVRIKNGEAAEAGKSVDKEGSADSIKLFTTDEDRARVLVACGCVCVFLKLTHIEQSEDIIRKLGWSLQQGLFGGG